MARDQWERSTFGGTHRRLGNRNTGRNKEQLRREASFDHVAGTSCLMVMVSFVAVILGVIFSV